MSWTKGTKVLATGATMHSFKNKWCIIYLDYKELYNLNTINGIESDEVMGDI